MVKRAAEDQISEHTDFEALEEDSGTAGTWEKAAPEVLANRKIRKIKRPAGGAELVAISASEKAADQNREKQGATKASNPFSGVSLVAPTSATVAVSHSLPPIATNVESQESASPQKSAQSIDHDRTLNFGN